ncbi:MAG: hypothetical protein GY828_01435 [Candidatus Gracilibacteria bacterium]|nr:hypothetical protein [Candidatus Gracilibacteria bacterium]
MNIRTFELVLVVSLFFLGVYFAAYKYYIQDLCTQYTPQENMSENQKIISIGSCKDSLVCELVDVKKKEGKPQIESWGCKQKRVDRFEVDYYKEKIDNLLTQ